MFSVLCFCLFSIITTISAQTYIDNTYSLQMRKKNILLHDIRNLLPFVYNIHIKSLLEIITASLPFYTLYIVPYDDKKILIFTWSFLVLIRTICFSITILPPPSHIHHPFRFTGGSCDAIFSGHTMMIVLNCMELIKYNNPYIIFILCIMYSILVLITRSHYSVDVFVAYVITISVYSNIENNKLLLLEYF